MDQRQVSAKWPKYIHCIIQHLIEKKKKKTLNISKLFVSFLQEVIAEAHQERKLLIIISLLLIYLLYTISGIRHVYLRV